MIFLRNAVERMLDRLATRPPLFGTGHAHQLKVWLLKDAQLHPCLITMFNQWVYHWTGLLDSPLTLLTSVDYAFEGIYMRVFSQCMHEGSCIIVGRLILGSFESRPFC